MKRRRLVLVAVAAFAVTGCSTLSYYGQAVGGHLDLLRRSQPVADKLASPSTPAELRERLERAVHVREFASRELALPDNASYRRYADLERPFVVWNVFAAPELELRPRDSCFPVVGCVSYRGYYAREAAEAEAASLRAQGFDVFVGGVPAYSTLGWLPDPLLNTFINYPTAELARLLFHELAHQVVYVQDDTTFNESFAVAVEEEGVERWLAQHGSAADRERYERFRDMKRDFRALIARYRERLEALYAQDLPVAEKRAGKARLYAEMQADYQAQKQAWGGFAGYDRFFAEPNNALLVSIATYNELVPAFRALLVQEGGDMPRFYAAVKALSRLDKPERTAQLAALAAGARIAAPATSDGDSRTPP
jgi:predicted aminopeptidase